MAGEMQDSSSFCEPVKYNRRRLAGLRSSLTRQRKLLAKAVNSRNRYANIQKSINDILESIAIEHLNAGEYSHAYDLFFFLPDNSIHKRTQKRPSIFILKINVCGKII